MGTAHPQWIRGRFRQDRQRLLAGLDLPPVLATIDAHRRLRGPYTAAGTLLRTVLPVAAKIRPTLVARHQVEILVTTPELRGRLPGMRRRPPQLAAARSQRTRPIPRQRTMRIAHGIADFLNDLRRAKGGEPVTLVFENVHEADHTDRELLAVLLRRLDPELVTLVVCTATTQIGDPATDGLVPALDRYAHRHDVPDDELPLWTDPTDAALSFVASDGTEDHPRAYAAYLALPPARRAQLHDNRADELAAYGERSLRLGALAYHTEHGSDPTGAGAHCLVDALDYCVDLGFYHAAVELGGRARALIDPASQAKRWWHCTATLATALTALDRPDEAQALYDEARSVSQLPAVHQQAAYATALLYARHHRRRRRNAVTARAWLNQAVAFGKLLPAAPAAYHDGLALVERHDGNLTAALRVLDAGLAELCDVAGLAAGDPSVRATLRLHRAQVYVELGRLEDALADYAAVVELEPGNPQHHLDRGGLLRRMGRLHEALDDYQQAITMSPPWAEAYFRRGDTLAELGDAEGALADFGYVLRLEPDHLEARVNRAGLLIQLGHHDQAEADVETGLEHDPTNPNLLCLRGQLLAASGRLPEAGEAYSTAIDLDPALADAWALRGALHFETGELAAALNDLDRAAQLSGDPTMTFNRAAALQASGRLAEAIAAYDAVLAVSDDPDARLQRQICRAQLGAASVPRPR